MSHDHGAANRTRLLVALAITATIFVVELVGAAIAGSLALLADAGHLLSDLVGLGIALVATAVAARPATDRQTFGFQRAEVFGALANGLILAGVAIAIAIESVRRLLEAQPAAVGGLPVLLVAAVGLVASVVSLLVLRGGAHGSINVRGAYLEVLGDLFGSVAALIAGAVILTTGFGRADAIASLVIAAFIAPRGIVLLRDVFRVLSESVPRGTSVTEIRDHILATQGVAGVHDVHVWSITTGAPVFSAHVVVANEVFESARTARLLDALQSCLADHFDVAHSTFQLEPEEHAAGEHPHHD
ncbi:MAG: cation transporter [Salinibacterium sp.]|nr:MAG: cation transporter [Salinibacterium sp.]